MASQVSPREAVRHQWLISPHTVIINRNLAEIDRCLETSRRPAEVSQVDIRVVAVSMAI